MHEVVSLPGEEKALTVGRRSYTADRLPGGVWVAREVLSPATALALGRTYNMLAAIEFAAAGLSAGKTEHYGLGVMRDIAVRLTCQADPGELHTIGDAPDDAPQPTPRYERIVGLGRLINDEIYGQSGTHARLLIDRQRVYDVYRDGLAFQARRRGPLAMGAVGHGIVARTLGETEAQLAFAIEAEPAPEA